MKIPFVSKSLIIKGAALATPLGCNRVATWDALTAGGSIRALGRVPIEPPSPGLARVAQLALLAARDAILDAKWNSDDLHRSTTALIVGTSKGAIDEWLGGMSNPTTTPPASTSDNPSFGRRVCSMRCLANCVDQSFGLHSLAHDLARHLELGRGPCDTISAACASGLYALTTAATLLEHGHVDRAIIVAAESSLHPLILQSYRRLGVLAGGSNVTRPFDRHRAGFLVSEAAAAICVERAQPNAGDIILQSWATGADASHITGMNPNAPAMRHCLRQAISGPIDLIHAHATGTDLNDPIELAAIESTLDPAAEPPVVYSHKGALGHSMGASGLISVVLNAMMHRAGQILPNINTTHPIATNRTVISPRSIQRPIRQSAAISAGFAGPVAVVTLKTA